MNRRLFDEEKLEILADSRYFDAQVVTPDGDSELQISEIYEALVLYELALNSERTIQCKTYLAVRFGVIPEFDGTRYREAKERVDKMLSAMENAASAVLADFN